MASINAPAPAAHFSFVAKSKTSPAPSHLTALASSEPTSITVLVSGIRYEVPLAAEVMSVIVSWALRAFFAPDPVAVTKATESAPIPALERASSKADSIPLDSSISEINLTFDRTWSPSNIKTLILPVPTSIPAVIIFWPPYIEMSRKCGLGNISRVIYPTKNLYLWIIKRLSRENQTNRLDGFYMSKIPLSRRK